MTLFDNADQDSIEIQVDKKLATYILEMKSKLGVDIVLTQIVALLGSIQGVYKVDLKSPELVVVEASEWANCTPDPVINFVGYANG